jgi:hypothetical protein
MSVEREQPLDDRMQRAVTELSGLILQHYPDASFRLSPSAEEPAVLHLWARVDVDDPDEVVDLVLDRMMQIQIEDELPLFVIPVRTPERAAALRRAQAAAAPAWRRRADAPAGRRITP